METCYWRWYLEQPYGISWCKDVDAAGRWKPLGDRVIDGPKLSLGWLDGKVMISNMPLCRSECYKVIMPWCHIMAICSGSNSIIPLGFAWFCHTCTAILHNIVHRAIPCHSLPICVKFAHWRFENEPDTEIEKGEVTNCDKYTFVTSITLT